MLTEKDSKMAENPTFTSCPRCGENTLRTDRPVMNALSRRDNKTYVCSSCGTSEALEDFMGGARQEWVTPPSEAELVRGDSDY
jgi:predicted RNA-binding Zn-ribbon protein involved in translation (DUF1610 family)